MSNLADRSEARTWYSHPSHNPAYPKLGPSVEKHRRLNDDTPEGRKAYGQAVCAAIRSLQRSELMRAGVNRSEGRPMCASGTAHTEGKDILKAIRAQHRTATQAAANGPTFERTEEELERDYYRAMLESRGVDPGKIVDIMPEGRDITLWLQAAWNVIKTKRGTPYLVEAKAEPKAHPAGPAKPSFESAAAALVMGITAKAPKKRGRPFGSKNKPKLVAEPVKPAELPKPSKPRVPSHYLSSASSVAYHAAM
jgi:hypothetical protein